MFEGNPENSFLAPKLSIPMKILEILGHLANRLGGDKPKNDGPADVLPEQAAEAGAPQPPADEVKEPDPEK